jgi:hypothetical protein
MRPHARPVVIEIELTLKIVRDAVFEFAVGGEFVERFMSVTGIPAEGLFQLGFLCGEEFGGIKGDEWPVIVAQSRAAEACCREDGQAGRTG